MCVCLYIKSDIKMTWHYLLEQQNTHQVKQNKTGIPHNEKCIKTYTMYSTKLFKMHYFWNCLC